MEENPMGKRQRESMITGIRHVSKYFLLGANRF
jgi:hypothetical protein